ncbi:C6 transcription factor [Penicillium waksmanii]|uniref:C6 transcription factor n=1 Tax=Penicillium waksmanii TaxID=69791 RepID=UPI0025499656|nr:C6 transcription factor [Penicillium waksmanii]KAJ5988264.1 C6 transcription factor [Penicillium waksmanii]
MSASRFRPIRPHIPGATASVVDESENDTVNNVSIKRRSTACNECQRRRTKCISGIPCLECTKRNSRCIFEESSDKRRKSYERKIEEHLRYYRGLLDDLLEAIRHSSDDNVDRIFNIVRSGSSISEIQSMVKEGLSESESFRPAP